MRDQSSTGVHSVDMSPVRLIHHCKWVLVAGVFALLFCGIGPREAHGQYWLQTARLVTPIEDGPTRTFLDTLVHTIEKKDLKVRWSPDQVEPMSLSDLRSTLIEEHGTGITTANRVFIDYRFEIDFGSRLEREITSLHFYFRPGPSQEDIPVLYLNAQQGWVQEILTEKGTHLRTNEAAIIPFRRHLEFIHQARRDETQIVEVREETVREGFEVKKEDLIRKIERLMYGSPV